MSGDDDRWIGANEALHRATCYLGDEWEAKSELRRRAQAGRIRTKGIVRGQGQQLDAIFWTNWRHDDGRPDAALEDWVRGAFDGRSPSGPIVGASGVVFNAVDIDRYYPDLVIRRGRPPANWWPAAFEEIAVLIHEEGAPSKVEHLVDRLLERLAERGMPQPSRSAIQPLAKRIISRLRAS